MAAISSLDIEVNFSGKKLQQITGMAVYKHTIILLPRNENRVYYSPASYVSKVLSDADADENYTSSGIGLGSFDLRGDVPPLSKNTGWEAIAFGAATSGESMFLVLGGSNQIYIGNVAVPEKRGPYDSPFVIDNLRSWVSLMSYVRDPSSKYNFKAIEWLEGEGLFVLAELGSEDAKALLIRGPKDITELSIPEHGFRITGLTRVPKNENLLLASSYCHTRDNSFCNLDADGTSSLSLVPWTVKTDTLSLGSPQSHTSVLKGVFGEGEYHASSIAISDGIIMLINDNQFEEGKTTLRLIAGNKASTLLSGQ